MDEKHLSLRLEKASAYVPKNGRLADIGSDHAYLPCALVYRNEIAFAIAGEIVTGPFITAQEQVKRLGYQEKIDVRLGNGLAVIKLEDNINALTICGMGGALIASILEDGYQDGKLTGRERLILQPNIGEEPLRKWLMNHQYEIIGEELLEEDEKMYEIIIAEKSQSAVSYTQAQLTFGLHLREKFPTLFKQKWQRQLIKEQSILASLKTATKDQTEKVQIFETKIAEIERLLK
ncbi:tRNA (adenine(22)-N(1))-methyltransferase [Carnobacterium gallinarum]|uniref:tRNA (adenine(22)-N(1))-methyltransferase n=1 Tax=Carnobacterium gallinarum TaxID=2749 RepID=UPI00054F239D|nr:tRNA (adenine(22)-N(1))-methyltransferase TrmK [Carnobacterium gallinarum]